MTRTICGDDSTTFRDRESCRKYSRSLAEARRKSREREPYEPYELKELFELGEPYERGGVIGAESGMMAVFIVSV
jgi:hypothetical protein